MAFHPAVAGWFAARFGRPTDTQARTWAVTAERRHALVAAPTGSGKAIAVLDALRRRRPDRDPIEDAGRFVSGFSGEQFALPEAAAALRATARQEGRERVSISAADPLNLAGIVTPGEKVARLPGHCLLFEGGVPIAAYAGGEVHYLAPLDAGEQWTVKNLLVRRLVPGRVAPRPRQDVPAAP